MDFNKLFRKVTKRSELRKQKQIWKCFGVDYQAEKRKQEEIWRQLTKKISRKKKSPPSKQHYDMNTLYKIFVPPSKIQEYKAFKAAVYSYIRHRKDFEKIDSKDVELLARFYADLLYIEEIMSLAPKEEIRKYADALIKIHSAYSEILDRLKLTPKARKKIMEELTENDEITEKLKKLIGVK